MKNKIQLTLDLFKQIILDYPRSEIEAITLNSLPRVLFAYDSEFGVFNSQILAIEDENYEYKGPLANHHIFYKEHFSNVLKDCNFFFQEYHEILNYATLKDDEFRPVMNKPFINEDKVIATDSYLLVSINIKDCKFVLPINPLQEKAPNALKILNQSKLGADSIKFNIKEFFENNKKDFLLEKAWSENKGKCEDCNGRGVVEADYDGLEGGTYTIQGECPLCNGEGYFNPARQLSYKEITSNNYVQIFNSHIRITLFEKLYHICKILQNFDLVVKHNAEYPNQFLFEVDKLEILLMGYNVEESDYNKIFKLK